MVPSAWHVATDAEAAGAAAANAARTAASASFFITGSDDGGVENLRLGVVPGDPRVASAQLGAARRVHRLDPGDPAEQVRAEVRKTGAVLGRRPVARGVVE